MAAKVRKLLMEEVALHVPEMVPLQITGDQLIDIRCRVADFNVEHGMMKVGVLVLDTDVTTIAGTWQRRSRERNVEPDARSEVEAIESLRVAGPIHVRGDLANPDLAVDADRVVASRSCRAYARCDRVPPCRSSRSPTRG